LASSTITGKTIATGIITFPSFIAAAMRKRRRRAGAPIVVPGF
jgi:hypothetical protein